MECTKISSKKGDYSITSPPQKTIKNSNNLILYLKELEKEEETKPKISRRKEIIKIGVEINEIETKNLENINETKSCFLKQ